MGNTRIALNWNAFNFHGGAARRAFELHRRLQGELEFTAFVTEEFPREFAEGLGSVRLVRTAGARSGLHKLRGGESSWWQGLLADDAYGLWVTDTLPVIRLGPLRTLITVHDLRHRAKRSYVSPARYLKLRATMRSSLRRADGVIAVSAWGAREIADHYGVPPARLHVVRNGVDPVLAAAEAPSGSSFDRPFVLCVGHLEERKNLSTLIAAFAAMSDRWPGILVLAGGDAGCGDRLGNEARRRGLGDRVVFTGPVPTAKLRALYRDCELLVCPSLYEGFGMTVLEGMAMNRPVVASAIPPHVEVAGKAALLVDPGEGMDTRLAQGMLSVLEDEPAAAEWVRLGAIRAREFGWDEAAGELGALYAHLLQG